LDKIATIYQKIKIIQKKSTENTDKDFKILQLIKNPKPLKRENLKKFKFLINHLNKFKERSLKNVRIKLNSS